MKQGQILQEVSVRVLDKAIDSTELQGQGLQRLFDSAQIAQDPLLAQNVDILA